MIEMHTRRPRVLRTLVLGALLVLAGCAGAGPPHLDPASVRWVSTTIPSLGIVVTHPDAWVPDLSAGRGYVPFRSGRFMPLVIRWVDEQEGRRSGLWVGHLPSGAIMMAGIAGEQVAYTHYDGPLGARMVAWVIPWKGRLLGVEIRTSGGLDPVQRDVLLRIVASP
jgi:hypothetical protein